MLLRERLHPAPAVDEKHLTKLLQGLENENFAARRRAHVELAEHGDRIEGFLGRAGEQRQPPETKRRLEELLKALESPRPECLRELRALEVLEQIGGPEALRLLETLASGPPDARLTREAAAFRRHMASRE